MHPLSRDVSYSLRVLSRNPASAGLSVLILAFGISANAVVFTAVSGVLLEPLPVAEPNRVVVMWEQNLQENRSVIEVSLPNFLDWSREADSFENMAAFGSVNWGHVLTDRAEPYAVSSSAVSASFFDVLGVRPHLGRTFLPQDDKPGAPQVAILSYDFWQTRFGRDRSIAGQTIQLEGDTEGPEPFTVIGVMPKDFEVPRRTELWTPLRRRLFTAFRALEPEQQRRIGVLYVVGRLRGEVAANQARTEMSTIAKRLADARGRPSEYLTIAITPFTDYFLGSRTRPGLVALWAAVIVLLVTCCVNVAGLLMLRTVSRQREFNIRFAVGANRARIMQQLLVECGMIALAGNVVGILVAAWGVEIIRTVGPVDIPRLDRVTLNGFVVLVTCTLAIATTLTAGLVPAVTCSKPIFTGAWDRMAHGTVFSPRSDSSILKALVIAEFALAVVLLVAATLVSRSFLELSRVELGFDYEGVAVVKVTPQKSRYPNAEQKNRFVHTLLERLRELPSVGAAGAVNLRPLEHGPIGWDENFIVEGQPIEDSSFSMNPKVNWLAASAGYFSAMKINLIEGRVFASFDGENTPRVVLISENLARLLWPSESAIGKRVWTQNGPKDEGTNRPVWLTVVGVVRDVRYRSLENTEFDLYVPLLQSPRPALNVVVRTKTDPVTLLAALRSEALALDKNMPIRTTATMEQVVSDAYAPWRFNSTMFGLFAVAAILLAGSGLFGHLGYLVARKRSEIAVRIALGASAREVVRTVMMPALGLTFQGTGVGVLISLVVTEYIESSLYVVRPTDLSTFVAVVGFVVMVAFLAIYVPARRASEVQPATLLRVDQ